jgi:hypothetical protein
MENFASKQETSMTRDDIIRMAREAGFADGIAEIMGLEGFYNFAALVAAAEREACLALVNQGTGEATSADALKILRMERDRISAAIRARGEQEQPR